MKKFFFFLIALVLASILAGPSCIAKDPVLDVVIAETQKELQAEYSDDLSKVKKMTIFENTMKIYLTDDYPSDKLEKFARAATKIYGIRMRSNKKLYQTYHLILFQNKQIENKVKLKPIAECLFENGADIVEVKLLGLGSGKYDVK